MVELETIKAKRRPKQPKPVTCLSCGGAGVFADKGPNGLPAWMCEAYPGCDSYVGVHPGTNFALGSMAGPDLRAERVRTHRWLDRLWRGKKTPTRKEVYQLVGKVLGVRRFHIAQADLSLLAKLASSRAAVEEALGRPHAAATKVTLPQLAPVADVVNVIDAQLMDALFAGRRRRLWPTDPGGQAAAERGLSIGAISTQVDAAGRYWVRLVR